MNKAFIFALCLVPCLGPLNLYLLPVYTACNTWILIHIPSNEFFSALSSQLGKGEPSEPLHLGLSGKTILSSLKYSNGKGNKSEK